jgi:TPR repeat protein
MGEAYAEGLLGLSPSIEIAVKYLENAACQGDQLSSQRLITIYENHSVIPSKETAFHFYEQAKKFSGDPSMHLYYLAGLQSQITLRGGFLKKLKISS